MPSMLGSIVQGFKNYAALAKYQTQNNTVAQSYEKATNDGTSKAKGVAKAVAGGAMTFLGPPVVIGMQSVNDYRRKQMAEQNQTKVAALADCLKSHGISAKGAHEMATVIIMNHSDGYYISTADFKMWMVVASVIEPDLAQFTPQVADRLESAKSKLNLS